MNDTVTGLILKQSDYREADVLLTVMTAEYGKLSFIASGARKMTSKNAGSILPYTEAEIHYDHRPGKTIFRLKTARTKQLFRRLHEDLVISAAAGTVCDLCDAFCMSGEIENSDRQYELLVDALKQLNDGKDPVTVSGLYAVGMMELFGIAPDVDECVRCFSTTVSAVSARDGGFLCAECAGREGIELSSKERLKRFRLAVKAGPERFEIVEQAGGMKPEDLALLIEMIRIHAGVQIRSFSFFYSLISIE